jgi:hydroxyacylglutathione hydrolase
MIIRRLFDEKLAQASYLVACEHSKLALVVDPNRNVAQYIDAAAKDNFRIVAVTETHIHADYVSGSRELASRTGAQLYLSDAGTPDWKYAWGQGAGAEKLTDGSTFMVGDVRIEAIHTPGHTPEHMTFLVTDTAVANEPMGALTGDFIFVGDVGRPDLLERAAGFEGTMEAGARQLFASLQNFRAYPDYLQIWPGHGAGSACGKALGAMPQSTLGYEKLFNWALAETDEERFVLEVLSGQPEPPAYFAIMKKVNRDDPPTAAPSMPDEVQPAEIANAIQSGATVVDTRPTADFATSHLDGTINIPANKSFLNWAGALLPYGEDVWFIADSSESARRQLASDLALIGFHRIAGVQSVDRVEEASRSNGMRGIETPQMSIADASSRNAHHIVDVRGRAEYNEGHIPGAINIPLAELPRRVGELPAGDLVVHCQGGSRSAMAASVLQRSGRRDVANMTGGFGEWERAGNPVERGPE